MTHKEKCRKLKEVRKEIADKIGVDLHQSECTYKGECKGTCPRCEQEEKKLNKLLLSGKFALTTLAVSALSLTGCGTEGSSSHSSGYGSPSFFGAPKLSINDEIAGGGHREVEVLAGDIEDIQVDGEIEYCPPEDDIDDDIIELEGDVAYEIED